MRLFALAALMAALLIPGVAAAQDAAAPEGEIISPENVLVMDLETGESVLIELFPDVAPQHVERIRTLATQGFYDGVIFHRVIDGFMAQGGDPTGTGRGGSEFPDLPAEFSPISHARGIVSMARAADINSANSQFFIMLADGDWSQLDGQYTIWGRVLSGMEGVDEIAKGEPPANPTRILRARTLATEYPDIQGVPSPGPVPGRATFAEERAQAFDPLFDTDVDIDILTPVLQDPN